ncbi:hypothetical protein [Azospirillum brasilense]|uniref:hypothetical protein n=1 Tax=Azospirillum brasilense TaxID=192 RepID=UPI000E0AFF88|nr:hypothetical protein [Azospirillum brasilense]
MMLHRKRLVAAALGAALAMGIPSYGFAADLPNLSDFKTATTQNGCQLIPFADLRARCVEANNGLHAQDACSAPACQASAGVDENRRRQRAWSNCVDRRTATEKAFSDTLARFESLKKVELKGNQEPNKSYKAAMETITGRIAAGQPGHAQALRDAKNTLAACASQI